MRPGDVDIGEPSVKADRLGKFLDSSVRCFLKSPAPRFACHDAVPFAEVSKIVLREAV
ncbi:MAG: hypothetical protein ACI8P0_003635 [Planctomycetaceae bacterium]